MIVAATLVCGDAANVVRAQAPTFRSAVLSVQLDVAVANGNRPVAGLGANDFEVIDNGVRQRILDVTQEKMPLDVTLVIDVSGSLAGPLFRSLMDGVTRVRDRLRPDDRAALVTFNERIRDRVALAPARQLPKFSLGDPSGWTSLNDAMAVVLVTPPPVDRRQMAIVFTDGFDTSSFLDEAQVLEAAERAHIAMFFVGAVTIGGYVPTAFFTRVADATGGYVQIVKRQPMNVVVSGNMIDGMPTSLSEREQTVDQSFVQAFDDFRASYVVRYTLEGVPRDGRHELQVHVTKPGNKFTVRARSGYVG